MSINTSTIHGNVTRDPEFKVVSNGRGEDVSLVKFTLASSRNFKKANGDKGEETTFVDCELFGNGANVIQKYVHKGDPLLVEGSLKLDTWVNKEGQNRSKLIIKVREFDLLWRKGQGSTTSDAEEPVAAGVGGGDDIDF